MTSDQIVTVMVAVIAAVGASLVTGLLSRPKTKAEAGATSTGAEVSVSGDAREWARDFATRAQRAEERADAAEERADAAEKRADMAAARCDAIDAKLDVAIRHIRAQQAAIADVGGHPPSVPAELIPPLS